MEQLSEQDAGFLYLETPETPQHVGGVSLVQLPADYSGNFYENYKRHIASRMHLIPLLHRKLVAMPFDIDHPYWAEDDQIDIDYHIRQQSLPSPGRMSQLEELVGRLHSNFLDRSRPLWEFYVIQGLENGQVAIYTKIHHAGMDGGASLHLVETMYDLTPVPRQLPAAPDKGPSESGQLGVGEALRGLAEHVVRREIRALQAVPDVLKAFSKLALPDAATLKYDDPHLPPLRPPRTLFNVAISSQRAFAARSLPMGRFKRIAKLADVKLNDVVLAVCAAVLRAYLLDHGNLPKRPMTAMVPVSLREAGDTRSANQNAAIMCSLATDLADPVKRLAAIKASTGDQKKQLQNFRNLLVPDLSLMGTAPVMRGLVDLYRRARLADRLPPLANLPISNVPGPPVPLYIAGARLLSFSPCSMPYHGQSLNITVQSYCDMLDFGLVACRRTVPDLNELADRLLPALDELEAAVQRKFAPAPAAGKKAASGPAPVPLPVQAPPRARAGKPAARPRKSKPMALTPPTKG